MMSDNLIKFKFNENWQNNKLWIYISLALLVLIVILGTYIRTTNIDDLKSSITGEYVLGPDLDPFLFLRVAGEIVEHGEPLKPDYMRYLGMANPYYNFVPFGIAYLYKFLNLFSGDITLEYVAIIFPVIFFGLSIVSFFFLVREIFHNREEFQKDAIAVIASGLYSVMPVLQHRTTAGIPELESAGLFFFWLSFFLFLKAWNNKKKILKIDKSYLFGLGAGISTCLMVFTWGGFRFIFISIAFAVFVAFFFGKVGNKETVIYSLWFIPSVFFFSYIYGGSFFDLTGPIIPVFVFLMLIINVFIGEKLEKKAKELTKRKWMSKEVIVFILTILLGFISALILNPDFALGIFADLGKQLLNPLGTSRIGSTVAENKALYLTDLFSSLGKSFFWMFFFGAILLFYEAVKHLEKKEKAILTGSFILFITGFIFSKYSSDSVFNGENFISQTIYFGSIIVLVGSFVYVYLKNLDAKEKLDKFREIEFSYFFVFALLILMMVASRSIIRLILISSPVFIIPAAFLPVILLNYNLKTKDEFWKICFLLILLVSLFYTGITFNNYEEATALSVKSTIPNQYYTQWEKAMFWVRENTPEKSIFVHWWDYGYWVQTIGQRPTVADGGHFIGYWPHLIGRYVLTTPYPETALSFMKTHKVSYLLIDSSDIGKYSAYSSIGNDENKDDRSSWIPVMVSDPKQIQETSNGTLKVYGGGFALDKDVIYNLDGKDVFLPANNAGIGAVILQTKEKNESISFAQPEGIFVYNGNQIRIPIRYLYYDEKMLDFKSGLNITIDVIPLISSTGSNYQIDKTGSIIYLSEKTMNSLVGQLYLLNDPFKKYPTVTLAHSEDDAFVSFVNSQGANVKDFVYFNGLRGPIKIWKVDYPENIVSKEEFLRTS